MSTIDNTQDVLDTRDVIARYEELRDERDGLVQDVDDAIEAEGDARILSDADEDSTAEREAVTEAREFLQVWLDENADELAALAAFLEELKGSGGGDEQWEGDWYPVTLVRESYFTEYAQELADDIGAIPRDAAWPMTCIDWEQAARELRYDYTGADFDGVTYYSR